MNKDEMASIADELSGTALGVERLQHHACRRVQRKRPISGESPKPPRSVPDDARRMATGHRHAAAARMRIGGLDNSVEEFAMTRTTMKPRASLTVRIVLAVMAALLVMAALWAIVNLAAVK